MESVLPSFPVAIFSHGMDNLVNDEDGQVPVVVLSDWMRRFLRSQTAVPE